ncbi:3-dehydroquinate synthase [Phormidium tenue]|uniref:3-dehydroquinate synthase n=1 Tax=Phormidium tenue NIES-30 TaxID=549789 RepID=A0A1U7J8J4_9CYAN|nr:3-dehydroquinate synthase [Phormidium tenue]MBD2231342.1 3-dehydroquinate synthase [Phormidium tenue FACHB-1052]OKH49577.1 3-dehydroquinate synthase [Phormidium tenue NIES-30]
MKSVIPVPLPSNPYDVVVATDGIDHLGTWLKGGESPLVKPGQKLLLVSNPAIFKRYGDRALASLIQADYAVETCLLPAGERYKTPGSLQKIYDAALDFHLERKSAMVALGGGVVGDMTGFAAATWLRGVNVVQVPTSLLAMVDASIGGKTGVNHPRGKNLIGAFHQPRLVMIDPTVLKTLPVREFRAGMAEVIKYGVIWDRDLFETLEAAPRLDQYRYVGDELLHTILTRSCQAKADVVSQDEREAGLRAILNYGHTIGHAVESLMNYRGVNHGEAVAIGMVAVGKIATALDYWTAAEETRQLKLIEKAGLPTQIPAHLAAKDILSLLQGDKKVEDGQVRFVMPDGLGAAKVTGDITHEQIVAVLEN